MRYLFINSVFGRNSTGKLVASKCHELQAQGHVCVAAWGRECIPDPEVETWQIGSLMECNIHAGLTRFLDINGFGSVLGTKKFLERMDAYQPDVVWLHNLHGYYIHIGMLFDWLRKHPAVKVYWTLHDCWAFTGHCAYFTIAKCDKWKTGCGGCSQIREYPVSYTDFTARNYRMKKKTFTGVKDLTLITPSQWLADLTRDSFLKEYPVEVVNNRIDTTVFRPVPSNFREQYGIQNQKMVLGVCSVFEETKGLPDLVKMYSKLDDSYAMVLIGVPEETQKTLPKGIIALAHVANQQELAGVYSTADVFVNPTHQDNYPTVNLEARACGTPVVTYNVGGSPESAGWEHVIPENDIDGFVAEIRSICEQK